MLGEPVAIDATPKVKTGALKEAISLDTIMSKGDTCKGDAVQVPKPVAKEAMPKRRNRKVSNTYNEITIGVLICLII